MAPGEFEYRASVDANGVMLVRVAGLFDAHAWLARHAALLQSDQPPPLHQGRPTVVDLIDFLPSENDWAGEADIVFGFLKRVGHRPGRRAMIVGDNGSAPYALRFYDALAAAHLGEGGEMRLFKTFEEGYDWVSDGQAPPAQDG